MVKMNPIKLISLVKFICPVIMERNKKKLLIRAIIAFFIFAFIIIFLKSGKEIFTKTQFIAVVNNQKIERTTYQARKKQLDYFANWLYEHQSTSSAIPADLLDELIEETLTLQFAKEHNLLPSGQEIKEKYQQAVKSIGTEKEYLEKIKTIQGIGKDEVLQKIKLELTKEKIEKFTKIPFDVWIKTEKEKADIKKYYE